MSKEFEEFLNDIAEKLSKATKSEGSKRRNFIGYTTPQMVGKLSEINTMTNRTEKQIKDAIESGVEPLKQKILEVVQSIEKEYKPILKELDRQHKEVMDQISRELGIDPKLDISINRNSGAVFENRKEDE